MKKLQEAWDTQFDNLTVKQFSLSEGSREPRSRGEHKDLSAVGWSVS